MISIHRTLRSALAGIALAAMSASGGQAATADVVLTIEEIAGSQTLFKAEGALNLTTLSGLSPFPAFSSPLSSPAGGAFGVGETGSASVYQQSAFSSSAITLFGTGGSIFGGDVSGPIFAFSEAFGGSLRIDVSYASGTQFTSTNLVSGDFAGLGITPGVTASYTLNDGQTISLEVLTPTPIPVPPAAALLLGGLGALGLMRRRRA
mgnify:CR=1 FL=1